MDSFSKLNCGVLRLEAGSKDAQVLDVSFQTMLHLIGNTSLILSSSFQYRVWSDVIYKMLAEIRGKICEPFVTQSLHCTDDRRRVDVVAFCHLARRKEE